VCYEALGIGAPDNPLQLSRSSGIKPRPGDPEFNIDKALDIRIEKLSKYDLYKAIERYNGHPLNKEYEAQRVFQVFDGINATETKFEFSPKTPLYVPPELRP
jgi:hypothetical protein